MPTGTVVSTHPGTRAPRAARTGGAGDGGGPEDGPRPNAGSLPQRGGKRRGARPDADVNEFAPRPGVSQGEFLALDVELHRIIAAAAHNDDLVRLLASMSALATESRELRTVLAAPQRAAASADGGGT